MRIFRTNAGRVCCIPPSHAGRARKLGLPTSWLDLAPAGTSDLTGLVGPTGRYLAVEVKSARGVQNPAQLAFERMVRSLGGIYFVAHHAQEAEELLNHELDA